MLRILMVAGMLLGGGAGAALAQATPPVVGGDADSHGCHASAGYTYSVLRQDCVRSWEAGIKLMPVKPQGSGTFAAYVVFASGHDGRQAELFLYDHKGSLLLKKTSRGGKTRQWKGDGYTLVRHKGAFSLKGANGEVLYRQSGD